MADLAPQIRLSVRYFPIYRVRETISRHRTLSYVRSLQNVS